MLYSTTNLSPNSLTGPSTRRSGEIAALKVKNGKGPGEFSDCVRHCVGRQRISYQSTIENGLQQGLIVCCVQIEKPPGSRVSGSGLIAPTAWVGRASSVSNFCEKTGCGASGGESYW